MANEMFCTVFILYMVAYAGKWGMMGAWVGNRAQAKVKGSCNATLSLIGADGPSGGTSGGTGGGVKAACINGADRAQTPVGYRRIDQLQIGDYVAVKPNAFEPIAAFLHRDGNRNAPGFQFTTSNGTVLTLSDEHLLFLAPERKAILAKHVKTGHRLFLAKNDDYVQESIIDVTRRDVEGLYSPLTPSGTILVNDVLVSCYSQIEDHELMHRVVSWLMPLTASLNFWDVKGSGSSHDGIHWLGEALWHHFRHWFLAVGSS